MPARELRGCAVVFVLGGPGSGKGTQSQMVAQRYGGWAHLSTGELLKAEAATGSEQGMEIESYIGDGKMVPVEITIGLTKAAMQESDATKFLIDGFPREKSQVNLFEEQVGASFESIIAFTAPDEVLQERILKRGENASSGRTDDNLETLQKRLNTYQTFTVPVIECFRGSGKLHEVSAVGSPEEVFVQVSKIIEGVEARIAECAKSSTGGTAPNGAGALGSSHERLEATAVERGSEVAEMKTTQEAPQSKDSAKNTQCGQVLQNGKQKANTMPTRQYMDETVVPVLREGLRALNVARPTDPLQFLADFLISYKKKVQEGENG